MRKQTKITLVLMAAMLMVSLLGCGKKEADPLLGRYDAYAVESGSMTMLASEFLEKESYIELKEKKKAVFAMEGEPQNLKWEADDDEITFSDAVESMDGTIEDGIIALDFAGAKIYFAKGWADTSKIKTSGMNDILNNAVNDALNGIGDTGADNGSDIDDSTGITDEEVDDILNELLGESSDDGASDNGLKKSPTEPKGASGKNLSMEDLLRLAQWLHVVEDLDYDTVVANFGEATVDCGNNGDDYMTEWGDHYFDWKADDINYIHVGFRTHDGITWTKCGFNTSGFSFDDCADADISGLPFVD